MPRQSRMPSVVFVETGKSPGVQNMSPRLHFEVAQVNQQWIGRESNLADKIMIYDKLKHCIFKEGMKKIIN